MAADISVCPGVDSASENEYRDIPGGKGGRCVRVTTLPPSCAECLVIWSLNRPEPSGPHRAVIGIADPEWFCLNYINTVNLMPYSAFHYDSWPTYCELLSCLICMTVGVALYCLITVWMSYFSSVETHGDITPFLINTKPLHRLQSRAVSFACVAAILFKCLLLTVSCNLVFAFVFILTFLLFLVVVKIREQFVEERGFVDVYPVAS